MTKVRPKTLEWIGDDRTGYLKLLDQTRLPRETTFLDCRDVETVWHAIKRLSVRGAPAIGVSAAYGLVVGLMSGRPEKDLRERFREVAELLGETRPTAVNLQWALDRGQKVFDLVAEQ